MILAIDTATRWTGLALHDGTAVLAESGWYSAHTQTVELAPAINDLLKRGSLGAADLSGIAIAIGPGSYTGLRIGLGLAKGMALANGTPLIGVSTLDILAISLAQADSDLIVVAEAGRSRVCAGFYRWQPLAAPGKGRKIQTGWQMIGPAVVESWPDLLEKAAGSTLFAGEISPQAAKLIRASDKKFHLASPSASVRRAGYLAEMGWQRLRKGALDDAANLAPIYLRDPSGK